MRYSHRTGKRPSLTAGRTTRSIAALLVIAMSAVFPPSVLAQEYLSPDVLSTQTAVIKAEDASKTAAASASVVPADATMAFLTDSPISEATSDTQSQLLAASGRSLYVSLSGSDSNEGSETSPWRSVQGAINKLQPGDTLFIKEGTYKETANWAVSGTLDAPITVRGVGTVIFDGTTLGQYDPIFETKGFDHLRFENLTVNKARSAVEVSAGSTNIVVDGLKTDGSQFAVNIKSGENVTVRNVYAINSRNAFRAEGTSKNLLYENIETYGSADRWAGYNSLPDYYLNGDGFIFEDAVSNITIRNVISGDHADGGFDIKGSNVLVENVVAFGNKNNFKLWGTNIVIKNSLSYRAKRQSEGTVKWDGNGVNMRNGHVTFINTTFADNEGHDVKVGTSTASIRLENSIVASRGLTGSTMLGVYGGQFSQDNVIWFDPTKSGPSFSLPSTSQWADPMMVDMANKNYRLKNGSPAINAGNNTYMTSANDLDGKNRVVDTRVDAGSYEHQGVPIPAPKILGLTEGQQITANVTVKPDLTLHPALTGVDYLMDGVLVKQASVSPFDYLINVQNLANGAHKLTGVYKLPTGNLNFTINFTLNKPAVPAPKIIGLTEGQEISGNVTVKPDLTVHPNLTGVHYSMDGVLVKQATVSPFDYLINTANLAAGAHKLTGVYKLPTGDLNFTINFTVKAPVTDGQLLGITEGQTVSGSIIVKPNLTVLPGVRKVAYYVDGTMKTRTYTSPFAYTLDASTLTQGNHVFKALYTDATGDHWITVNFKVGANVPPPVPAPKMIGLTEGQEVTQPVVVTVKPDLTVHHNLTGVHYSMDGVAVKQALTSPFDYVIDTTKLTAGTHKLTGIYKLPTGDLAFTINFTVKAAPPAVLTGITEGQTLTAPVTVKPNLTLNPSIRKVFYYLNGTKYAQAYTSPFSLLLDPAKLAKGTHTLKMIYTTSTGDKNYSVTFTV